MPVESFLVTALPHSADPAAPFHVSLFVALHLKPDGADGRVADFAHARDWTRAVAGAGIHLYAHRAGGTRVELTARRVGALEPDLWPRVFPPELPVHAPKTKDRTLRPWHTFPASRMDEHTRRIHNAAMAASPVTPPTPDALPFLEPLLAELGYPRRANFDRRQKAPRATVAGGRTNVVEWLLDNAGKLEAEYTRKADARLETGPVRGRAASGSTIGRVVGDVHAARRYYQRPEDLQDPSTPRDPAARLERPGPPPAEFHQRQGRLGDLSPLLRALGLVIDVVVDDLDALDGIEALSADLHIPGFANAVGAQPRTACTRSGTSFTAKSTSGRWRKGMLRLGRTDLYTVLDLDPDASALKLEQYLRTVPRLLALQYNGATAQSAAAPPALRSTGFAIAETDRAASLRSRLVDAPARADAVTAGTAPPLELDQVTRGLRVEVWDSVSGVWHSLHKRLLSVSIDEKPLLERAPDEGLLQGAALTASATNPTTTYAHEVVTGWDGWSLSAPRPEKVVVHQDGKEVIHPASPETGAEPVNVQSAVAPGTLPRLRYGRHYAFRAFAVDLAGNSVARRALSAPLSLQGFRRAHGDPAAEETATVAAAEVQADAQPIEEALRTPAAAPLPSLPKALEPVAQLRAAVASSATTIRTSRKRTLETAFSTVARRDGRILRAAPAKAPRPPKVGVDLDNEADVVTTARPFLRWSPLVEPAVVPRRPYTQGESLLRMVVRTGVDEDGATHDAVTYGVDTQAAHPSEVWRADSQRHLAPPKTSLLEAELHGMLDDAIGSPDPDRRRRGLAVALREEGNFLSADVADLDAPGKRRPVPGLSFHLGPTAEPHPGTPVPEVATLGRGDPLLPGQYAVHDVDALETPYLPDAAATGLSLLFPDGDPLSTFFEQLGHRLGVQSLTLRYPGTWPARTALRLVLRPGPQLDGVVHDNVVEITLPPGEQLRLRLASAMSPEALDLFGLWRELAPTLRDTPEVAAAAADGWFWWLTPATELTLVHAVPRPVRAPRFTLFEVRRQPGTTTAGLIGGVEVHAPSTERVDLEASWSEWHDDPSRPEPERVTVQATAAGTAVGPAEALVLFTGEWAPPASATGLHSAIHTFGDTRHREVDYVARATTRYREFFPASLMSGPGQASRVSTPTRLSVPSTVRPPKVVVRDVVPMFRWHEETAPAHPFGTRRTRRSGLRLYLDRPWYASGDGELLAVVLGSPKDAPASRWASDPVWAQDGVRNATILPLVEPLHLLGLDDRPEAGRPVTKLVTTRLVDTKGRPKVRLLGYQPEFNKERGLWFVDVDLDPGTAFWPFVRLVVARYQPGSLPDCDLGPVAICDFGQLAPERSTLVARTADGTVKVAVTGAVGLPESPPARPSIRGAVTVLERLVAMRTMHVRIERQVADVGTDLGWQVVSATTLPPISALGAVVTWEGVLTLPPGEAPTERPGHADASRLRVVVEEEERLLSDPDEDGALRTSSRVVYLDHFLL